jgi:hypothetical protein
VNKKLTLSLEESIIERGKKYAARNGASLSGMVEEYLRTVTESAVVDKKGLSPTVSELLGSIEANPEFDPDIAKYEYLKEKYLHE